MNGLNTGGIIIQHHNLPAAPHHCLPEDPVNPRLIPFSLLLQLFCR